jgi:hypothetical protein
MRREDGTITTFALMIFILMVAVAGIAIDIMRYETQRVQLQYTLDRSVLAAASVTQPLNPVDVVENYFEISGLDNYRLTIDVEEGLNFRRVEAYAELEINTLFMHMFGVRVLTSPAEGAAEEASERRSVDGARHLGLHGLEQQADQHAERRARFRDDRAAGQRIRQRQPRVDLDRALQRHGEPRRAAGKRVHLSDEHSESSCVRFTSEQFTRTNIELTEEIERIAHWDFDDYFQYDDFDSPYCPTDQYGAILPWEHDEDVLHDLHRQPEADGWTAIDLGMKMGVALLDPAARERPQRAGHLRGDPRRFRGPPRQLRRSRDDQGGRADDGW